jgi:hypothetical protein
MSLTIQQALLAYNSRLTNEILADPDFIEATASGNFANFINTAQSIQLSEGNLVKYGTPYTTALDQGTPPGARQGLEADIYKWLKYKKYGLQWETDKERQLLAGRIARKIERKGSLKHREPSARTRIIANALDKAYPTLIEKMSEAYVSKTEVQIQNAINI